MSVVAYDAILGSGNNLRQVTRSSYSPNHQEIPGRASGAVDPSVIYGGQARPQVSLDTLDVAGLLGLVSVTAGLSLSSDTVQIPYNSRTQGGTFASGSSHSILSCANGLVIPTQFEASQDGPATASLDFHARSTSSLTNPISMNVNQSLASQAYNARHTLGPAYVNAAQLSRVSRVVVRPGIQVLVESEDGGNYPTLIFIEQRNPSIDILFRDPTALNTYGTVVAAMTSANVYFRKRSGAGFVSDVTAQHIKFTFTTGAINVDTVTAQETGTGEVGFRLTGIALSASNASAIP